MTSSEFFKKYGLEESKKAHALSINAGDEDLELLQLIHSHEEIERQGGLNQAKINLGHLKIHEKRILQHVFECESTPLLGYETLAFYISLVESCQ